MQGTNSSNYVPVGGQSTQSKSLSSIEQQVVALRGRKIDIGKPSSITKIFTLSIAGRSERRDLRREAKALLGKNGSIDSYITDLNARLDKTNKPDFKEINSFNNEIIALHTSLKSLEQIAQGKDKKKLEDLTKQLEAAKGKLIAFANEENKNMPRHIRILSQRIADWQTNQSSPNYLSSTESSKFLETIKALRFMDYFNGSKNLTTFQHLENVVRGEVPASKDQVLVPPRPKKQLSQALNQSSTGQVQEQPKTTKPLTPIPKEQTKIPIPPRPLKPLTPTPNQQGNQMPAAPGPLPKTSEPIGQIPVPPRPTPSKNPLAPRPAAAPPPSLKTGTTQAIKPPVFIPAPKRTSQEHIRYSDVKEYKIVEEYRAKGEKSKQVQAPKPRRILPSEKKNQKSDQVKPVQPQEAEALQKPYPPPKKPLSPIAQFKRQTLSQEAAKERLARKSEDEKKAAPKAPVFNPAPKRSSQKPPQFGEKYRKPLGKDGKYLGE